MAPMEGCKRKVYICGGAHRKDKKENSMKQLSIIIPVKDRACLLEALLKELHSPQSLPQDWEIVIVDDGSAKSISELAKSYNCQYIRLETSVGPAEARNIGANAATGQMLFFTDSDCRITQEILLDAVKTLRCLGRGYILGGTYKPTPVDRGFFSEFQSIFVHYFETKKAPAADYIATHAMLIYREDFFLVGGFRQGWLPMIEDVEFSHRAKRKGMALIMESAFQVGHFFGFSLWSSLRNAFWKAHYWSIYLLETGKVFSDSGTGSIELKFAVTSLLMSLFLVLMMGVYGIAVAAFFLALNVIFSFGMFRSFYRHKGILWTLKAGIYFLLVYPVPVAAGSIYGLFRFVGRVFKRKTLEELLCSHT